MRTRWANYLQKFPFVIKLKSDATNWVTDALICRVALLTTLSQEVIGFEYLKELYEVDVDFGEIWVKFLAKQHMKDYHVTDGFLCKGNRVCIHRTSLREKMIINLHAVSLSDNLGRDKTTSSV